MSEYSIRPATEADRLPLTEMWARVVEENVGLGTEPPVDIEERAPLWKIEGTFLAEANDEILGSIHVEKSRHGYAEIGMCVANGWRGKGVGSALMSTAEEWAREQGAHKLSLGVFAHNERAIALYVKHGFVEEGRRVKHYRRKSGDLYDSLEMGKLLS
ncbi:MAG TPA: GNAT family N-acetyltransferase [Gaiellaceae bacterium]|nr:GNAT family N-acetyltransferase [Gaiellaceae bacterium]